MISLKWDCIMYTLSEEDLISDFDCGDADLNDFLNHDTLNKRIEKSRKSGILYDINKLKDKLKP